MPAFSLTKGSDRTLLGPDELAALKTGGTVIIDERRRRTRYFDGRFLAAKDQIRDQEYVLTRLSDLGRAGGMGVVSGLMLTAAGPNAIRIGLGNGITPAGEMVLVPNDITIDLSDIAAIEQIDAAFGLSRIPRDPARNRTGLFVVGLRPVEYTANPIASYPTTVSGRRTLQDGDIIEASAVVFIPYPVDGSRTETDRRRSQVARRIFVDQGALGVPDNVLPLAMVAVDRGVIQWVDAFMVRREVGAEHGSILGLGYTPRALREAHILQYHDQLREIMQLLEAGNRGQRFPASDYFDALPPAGVVPAAAIDPADFSQIFFPPQIETELSVLPSDEAAVLVEESMLLPPINLTDSTENLQSTSVLFLVPLPRAQLKSLQPKLGKVPIGLKAAAPGIVSRHLPLQSLRGLVAARVAAPPVNTEVVADAAWRAALALNPLLWYVRRRNLDPATPPPTLAATQPTPDTSAEATAQPAAEPPPQPVEPPQSAPSPPTPPPVFEPPPHVPVEPIHPVPEPAPHPPVAPFHPTPPPPHVPVEPVHPPPEPHRPVEPVHPPPPPPHVPVEPIHPPPAPHRPVEPVHPPHVPVEPIHLPPEPHRPVEPVHPPPPPPHVPVEPIHPPPAPPHVPVEPIHPQPAPHRPVEPIHPGAEPPPHPSVGPFHPAPAPPHMPVEPIHPQPAPHRPVEPVHPGAGQPPHLPVEPVHPAPHPAVQPTHPPPEPPPRRPT